MYMLNKRYMLEFVKRQYFKINSDGHNISKLSYFKFGSFFPYQSFVHELTTDLQLLGYVDWLSIAFPNLELLIISTQSFYPFSFDVASKLLNIALKCNHLVSFSLINCELLGDTNLYVKKLKHLKVLKLKLMPIDLIEYKSFSSISKISVTAAEPKRYPFAS